jgi:hypothetical protein
MCRLVVVVDDPERQSIHSDYLLSRRIHPPGIQEARVYPGFLITYMSRKVR